MKTVILYATKYGAAQEVAHRMEKLLGDATVVDIKKDDIPALDQFDCVIVGSSIYAGSMHKEMKAFIGQNESLLLSKPLGLFICGLQSDTGQEHIEANYPSELLQHAKASVFTGSIFDPKKANAMERLIMKKVAKIKEYTNTIDDEKIARFIETLSE